MPTLKSSTWILFGLAPLAVLVMGLHVREVVRTGLAQPPIYAAPAADASAYPTVGGTTVEVQGTHELEVGDRLIRIGERDLRGRGYLGFLGLAFEEADDALRVPLIYERAGERRETMLTLTPYAIPWLRIPFLAMMLVLTVLLLPRRPDDPFFRLGAITFCAVGIGESIFEGGGYAQTVAAKLVFIFGGAIWWPLVIRFVSVFPGDEGNRKPVRHTRAAMVASAGLFVLPKLLYLNPGPFPPSWTPAFVYLGDGLTVLIVAAVFAANYQRSSVDTRRRMKLPVYAAWAAGLPMFFALLVPVVSPGVSWFGTALAMAGIAAGIIPIAAVVAILGYDLFDIDRLISATASYSLLLALFLAALVAGVPSLASSVSDSWGVGAESTRLALSVLVAGLAVPFHRWLRPRIDGWFFPERHQIESGIEALLKEQTLETHPEPLARLMAQRLQEIFKAEFAVVFALQGTRYEATDTIPEGRAPATRALPRLSPPIPALRERSLPLAIGDRRLATSQALRSGSDSVFEDATRPALLLPVRSGDELPAFIALGPKASGDGYPATEIALLSATADAARNQLERVHQAEDLARERVRSVELDRKRREAEAAHLSRSRHLAAASHDLRQPLHALRLFAEALVAESETPKAQDLAQRVQSSAEALHEMFDALIDLSRMDQGTLVPAVSSFALGPLLDRLRAESEPTAESKGLILDGSAPDVEVSSDPVLLSRIVQNLLTNALRYTDSGRVTLRAEAGSDHVILHVEDTGPGIPESRRDEIFDEFVRLEPEKSQRGLGLGLAIVKRVSELLDHPVSFESRPGRGTHFQVRVPRPDVASEPARSPLAQPLGGRHLLLLDDDLDVLIGMRALLESWGASVVLATDGDEALEAIQAPPRPDAVIADYRLRDGETGVEVIHRLRETLGDVPALVITGSTSGEVGDELERAGLTKLQKPVSPARLRAALSQLLR